MSEEYNLGPFRDRLSERSLYTPLPDTGRMLELGDKCNKQLTYKAFFESLGWEHVSVDWNGEHGALKLDLQEPLNLGTFDIVTNIGTTEHVTNQTEVWRNVLEAMQVGSILLSATPIPGDWVSHGFWYPDNIWYEHLCAENGLTIERLYLAGDKPRRMWFLRAIRTEDLSFTMPARPIYYNAGGHS